MDGISAADIAIAGVLAFSGFLAYFRGFVRELLALATWVGSAAAALYAFGPAKVLALRLVSPAWLAGAVAGIAVFILAFAAFSLMARPLIGRVKGSAFNGLDRLLGLLFGLLRGAFLLCLAFLMMSWLLPRDEYPGWIEGARALPFLERGAALLRSAAPRDAMPEPAKPTKDAAPGGEKGYKSDDRQDLDRLIRQTME